MSRNYSLKYRTFDELLSEVHIDFKNYDLNGLIEPQTLIRVAMRCNRDLGLRIYIRKEKVLEVEKGVVKLPDDFHVLNYALLCASYTVSQTLPQGTHIEEIPLAADYIETPSTIDACGPGTTNCTKCNNVDCECGTVQVPPYDKNAPYGDYCVKPRTFFNCKGEAYELVQVINTEVRTYSALYPLKIINNPQTIDCDCPNLYVKSANEAWIKDGYLHTNFDCGNVYINYQGNLEDDDGNLLVPDHDILNEYYEYALKQRIIENMVMNDASGPGKGKVELIEARYRASRNNALSLVNTPNFAEMRQVWETNRKAQYSKYYDMFKSFEYERKAYHKPNNW